MPMTIQKLVQLLIQLPWVYTSSADASTASDSSVAGAAAAATRLLLL
jgi:hypothetical protein